MNKYMAAGRHGGYRDDEVKNRASDFDVSKREFPYAKGVYDRLSNGNSLDYENGRNPVRDSRDRGRIREEYVKERGLVKGRGYLSGCSRSDSEGSHDCLAGVGDREPGELSSESGSDEAVDWEMLGKKNEGSKIDNGVRSPLNGTKRKFSPIVWDINNKEVRNSSKSRVSSANAALESNISPGNSSIDIVRNDSSGFELHAGVSSSIPHEEHMGLSSSPVQEGIFGYIQDIGQSKDEDYVPAHNIRSSRWTNDVNSPTGYVERRSQKESSSPEVGELNGHGSEETRGRSSEPNDDGYRVRSSNRDAYLDNGSERKDHMEIDEGQDNDEYSVSQSNTDSESEDGSPGTPESAGFSQRSVNMLQCCRSVNEFERLNKIDEGTYGVVYRAKDRKSGEVVALKKVKMEKEREGFPLTSLREMNILLSFHHPSIVDVKEIVVGGNLDSIFMVMEYMEHDLKALMETIKQPFSQSEVKCLMLQLLEGTKYLHDNWVLHRDLKTSNILLNNRGELKICDFGLARQYGSPLKPYTPLVVTLWYRAPELLLGGKQYSTAIDMWSLGCIMAELLSKQPLFNGKTEVDQLDKIFKTIGTPNEAIWPGFSKLPGVKVNFVKHKLPGFG